jgi:hypothetical protein
MITSQHHSKVLRLDKTVYEYYGVVKLDGGAIRKELCHAIEGGSLQISHESDDANVIYK